MILAFLFFLLHLWITYVVYPILSTLSNLVNFAMPSQIPEAFNYFTSILARGGGWFPMDTLLECIAFLFTYFLITYIVRIFLWVIHQVSSFLHGGASMAHTKTQKDKPTLRNRSG